MIRFGCPRCKAVLERPDSDAGSKLSCPSCQQRLQIPLPPEHKTVVGNLMGAESAGIKAGPLTGSKPPAIPPEPRPLTTLPVAHDAWEDSREDRPRRGERARRDIDDDDEREGPRARSERGYSLEDCTRAATVGFVCSLVSMGLIFTAMLLWMVLISERPHGRQVDPFVFLILALGLGSFVMGLIGVIFASRGLDRINTQNRGLAVTGLVCGIIGMVIGLIGSTFFFCVGMVLMALPWR